MCHSLHYRRITSRVSDRIRLDICQHNDSTILVNLCLHHEFILHRKCQFLSQIFVICEKFWFYAFILRKLRLSLIECSQVLTVKLGSVRVEAERCWTAFLCIWTAAHSLQLYCFQFWKKTFQCLKSMKKIFKGKFLFNNYILRYISLFSKLETVGLSRIF